jgi:hypothetical protein
MVLNIVFSTIFFLGTAGMLFIILRKLPVLSALPDEKFVPVNMKEMVSDLGKTKGVLSLEMVLQKVIARLRILILKSDNKTFNWLQTLREKSQKTKFGENDTYWKDVKNMKK